MERGDGDRLRMRAGDGQQLETLAPVLRGAIRSSVVTPIYTEGPRILHEAGLNGGVAWRAAKSRDF